MSAVILLEAHRCQSALRRTKRGFFPGVPPGAAERSRSSVLRAAAADAAMSNGMLEERLSPAGGVAYGEYTMRLTRGAGVGVPVGE
jgi:hypothetical protein